MKVVLSYSAKDYNLAFSAADILISKTKVPNDKLILYGSQFAPEVPAAFIPSIGRYIQCGNDSPEYPVGPNKMIAWLFRLMENEGWDEPVFLCEPDGFPTTPDWYERVMGAHWETHEYASGSYINWVDPKHYNGNMVVDPICVKVNPSLKHVAYDAWDCFHADFFTKVGANNKEIYNPRRTLPYYPTSWWFQDEKAKKGEFVPAWIHGCQNFQAWERIKGWEDVN